MSEKDKLFTFMEGLKPWAHLELQLQRVTDLNSAMTAAERLADFNPETRRDRHTTPSPAQNKPSGARSFRSNSNRGGGEKSHAQSSSQDRSGRNKPQENRQGVPQRSNGCFLCDGPHRFWDCPKKQLMNVLAAFTDKESPAKSVEPKASTGGENYLEEDEDNLGAVSQWCSTLSMVVAKRVAPPHARKTVLALTVSQPKEEVQPRNPRKKGLM
ncbi:UNVERIFIED_CONTAM: hypothetical protein Sindi_0106300 [Sesamum indicum]